MNTQLFNVRGAIICYQYSERVKSELIIANKILAGLNGLRDEVPFGAERTVSPYDRSPPEVAILSTPYLRLASDTSLAASGAIGEFLLS